MAPTSDAESCLLAEPDEKSVSTDFENVCRSFLERAVCLPAACNNKQNWAAGSGNRLRKSLENLPGRFVPYRSIQLSY
ncbi:hypothetical protein BaRGS_00014860 [Batillaria attramentaria]|uniref:Uncharacterized protein n=1 Tax=Batillaria attramentaria TaxID=370345 RepID=A0ABD0L3U6_9CAEN